MPLLLSPVPGAIVPRPISSTTIGSPDFVRPDPETMTWNDKTFTSIVEKHPELDSKPESVAVAVWALKQNKNMSPDDWRDLSKKTGVKVLGRAVGSARQLLGMEPKVTKKKGGKAKRGPGRPKGSRNRATSGGGSLVDLLSSINQIQKERNDAMRVLAKIRDEIDRVL